MAIACPPLKSHRQRLYTLCIGLSICVETSSDQFDRAIGTTTVIAEKNSNERSTDRIGCRNKIGNCLLASKKRRRKPFAPRVSKHRYCTPRNLARRALIRENQRHPAFPEDHLYRVAQILRLLRLFRDSFFSILSWTRPESFANLNEITDRNPRAGDINGI